MNELDLRADAEEFSGEMRHGAGPDRRVSEFAGLGPRQFDELLDTRYAQRGMNREDERQDGERRHRREILSKVEAEIGIDGGASEIRCSAYEQRVAVRWGTSDELRRQAAAGARPAFHHHLLAERLAHGGADDAGGDIGRRTWREADARENHPHAHAARRQPRSAPGSSPRRQSVAWQSSPCCGLLCPMSRSPPHQPIVSSIGSAKRSYSPAGQEAMSLIGTPERARWVHQTRGDMGIWKAIRKSTSRSPCDEEVATPLP